MQTIDAKQLATIMEQSEKARVIDTLPEESYQKQHIPGALSVPGDSEDFVQQVRSLVGSKDDPVIVYCANTECGLSPTAGKALEKAGFSDVRDFEGGLQEWKTAGHELVGAGGSGTDQSG